MVLKSMSSLENKKVLIIVENLPVPFDRRVWMEATTLLEHGAQVSIICPKSKTFSKSYEYIDGIHIYRHSLPTDGSGAFSYIVEYLLAIFWEFYLTTKVFFKHGIDVIHGCNPPDLVFLIALPFKIFGVKYIFDHHDINPELYEAKFNKRGLFWSLLKFFERMNFKFADVSIATNESYKKIAINRGKMLSDKVFVVRSGPDLKKFIISPYTKKWHKGKKYMVGYVGVMGDQEGIDLLLESIEYLVYKKQRSDIQFVIVGGGPSLEQLKKLTIQKNIKDHVTFTGRVPDNDLFEVLSNSDICVNPDRVNAMNNLSTMNKILEYMAFKKPIVQFDVTEGRFSASKSSLYAKPNDTVDFAVKIETLLIDENLRYEMGLFGFKRLETELSWEFQKDSLINAYLEALNS